MLDYIAAQNRADLSRWVGRANLGKAEALGHQLHTARGSKTVCNRAFYTDECCKYPPVVALLTRRRADPPAAGEAAAL